MPALNIDLDYFEHPKTMGLVAELGDWAEILPIRLWRFTARYHAETGVITARSMKTLETHLKWRGKKGEAVGLLVSVGFLEPVDDGGYAVHDFLDHQGHIESFSIRGKTAAKARWDKMKQKDASSIPEGVLNNATSNALTDGAERTDGRTDGADGINARASPRSRATSATKPQMHPPPKTAEELAQLFAAWYTGTTTTYKNPFATSSFFAELLRSGQTPESVAAKIQDNDRSRNQTTAQFEIWAGFSKLGGKGGPAKTDGRTSQEFRGTATSL